MPTPNIVNVTQIEGKTAALIPAVTTAVHWSALTPSATTPPKIHKIGTITASNVTNAAATITVAVHNVATPTGTANRIVHQISVPAYSTLVVLDKTTPIYIDEAQSIAVTVGTASALELVASYEVITGTAAA